MNDRRKPGPGYYEGVRSAMLEHMKITEEGLRRLDGLTPTKVEELVVGIHERHEKLLRRIDGRIREEELG